jgi:hypothetical protein
LQSVFPLSRKLSRAQDFESRFKPTVQMMQQAIQAFCVDEDDIMLQ